MITFKEIPSNVRTQANLVEFDPTQSARGLVVKPLRAMLIGGRRSSGTVAELTPTRVTSAEEVAAACGVGSTLHGLAQRWFGNGGSQIETWFVSQADDGAGVAAVKTLTLSGAQTAAGTIYLYIAGRRMRIAVGADSATDTLAVLAARVRDAINAVTELPVTASAAAAVVTVTAKNAGATGNAIDVRLNYGTGETLPPGLAIAIAAPTPGANNPDITAVWAAIGDQQFDFFVSAFGDDANYTAIDTELEARWGPTTANDGFAFLARTGTFGAQTAWGEARNSKHVSALPLRNPLNPTWEFAGAVAAVVAVAAQRDPAASLQQRELLGILPPALADEWTFDERNQLLFAGMSTFTVNANGRVQTDQIITVYQRNTVGAEDLAFYLVSHRLALSYIRWAWRARVDTKFVAAKLSGDETATLGNGQQLVTVNTLKAEAVAFASDLLDAGIIQDLEGFRESLLAEIDAGNGNRANLVLSPKLMGYLVVTATRIAFRL